LSSLPQGRAAGDEHRRCDAPARHSTRSSQISKQW
jgi:hypothetical protein